MDLAELLYQRRSVRDFAVEPVSREVLTQLIDAAIQAPSAVNEQPWSFTVVRDRNVLARISREAKAHLLRSPPQGFSADRFRERLSDPDTDILYGAPALILISSATQGAWAIENCALAAENLMLAACAEGLGSCWIGLAQPWLRTAEGHGLLGLPQPEYPVAPIIVGHPRSAPPPVPRRPAQIRWIGE